ncbi:MAG: hypothetical protein LBQ88_20135 [Treponema sp.]|jgi:hypothetical protein|nr:hypothetical protein [Treponema sp.]
MGLLSKAVARNPNEAAWKQDAFWERLQRITPSRSAPYTALSLFKAYNICNVAICLALEDERYVSYATVGLRMRQISIPRTEIQRNSGAGGTPYHPFKIETSPALKQLGQNAVFWAFPLDCGTPNRYLLLVREEEQTEIDAHAIELVLNHTRGIFIIPKGSVQDEPAVSESLVEELRGGNRDISGQGEAVEKGIDQFQETYPAFYGIVIEAPSGLDSQAKDKFKDEVAGMVNLFGTALSLSAYMVLVLLPAAKDGELIAHRLSNSFNTKILLIFNTDNSSEAFELVRPYL